MNPITFVLRVLIRGYQLLVSPVLPRTCRFEPTCSSYALEAVTRHGPIRGAWLALHRIGRCHPWADFGYDPVPEKKKHGHKHTHQHTSDSCCSGEV
ncbi:MAG: membrane protein insertion efficiency factor YidD [Rhodospirillales bacterium]|nr:membrane protein insertion efficiency factor YidD [Rhodospirillales bacterium]MCW8952735.1 membrane protein insertion efficiency factor YidD [Rhodospirillales bacterium]MCW8970131.1 membrane protein insertion efficiency factor YidD [Rhodospirillales bacterium]MCW9002678.1 membrane protein insertion efficiency factor YidD [Rhodospirillales bacterium]MCW9040392.1 membrane protein insertion efficiency factor YidD [Rhodospirillales bacterium]